MKKPLTIEVVRALADAGAVNHVLLIASPEGLQVQINHTFFLANRMKQSRYFARADTAFNWLRELGIKRIDEVDLTHWKLEKVSQQ